MRLVHVLTLLIGCATLFAFGGAVASARADQVPAGVAVPAVVISPTSTGAEHAPARTPMRPISSPSTFAMGVLTLAAFGAFRWRRRRFLAERAAL